MVIGCCCCSAQYQVSTYVHTKVDVAVVELFSRKTIWIKGKTDKKQLREITKYQSMNYGS